MEEPAVGRCAPSLWGTKAVTERSLAVMIKITTALIAVALVGALLLAASVEALAKAKAKAKAHRAKPAPSYQVDVRAPTPVRRCASWDSYGLRCDYLDR